MVFKRADALRTFTEGLGWIALTCEQQGILSLFDNHTVAPHFFCRLLNAAFDLQLVVLDQIQTNYPAIDLGDAVKKICYQITTDRSGEKVQHTLEKFVEHGLHNTYENLRILIIGKRQGTYKTVEVPPAVQFDCASDILGIEELVKAIGFLDTAHLEKLVAVFAEELNAQARAAAPKNAQRMRVEEFHAKYRERMKLARGVLMGQTLHLSSITDLASWRRAQTSGALKEFKRTYESGCAMMASSDSLSLLGSVKELLPVLNTADLKPIPEDELQRSAGEKLNDLIMQIGSRGPQSDVQVQTFLQAARTFLDISLTALEKREQMVEGIITKWLRENP